MFDLRHYMLHSLSDLHLQQSFVTEMMDMDRVTIVVGIREENLHSCYRCLNAERFQSAAV